MENWNSKWGVIPMTRWEAGNYNNDVAREYGSIRYKEILLGKLGRLALSMKLRET
jgi:hypothetical protein